jgi:hypothetical protein
MACEGSLSLYNHRGRVLHLITSYTSVCIGHVAQPPGQENNHIVRILSGHVEAVTTISLITILKFHCPLDAITL